jgi:hydroxyacylglutathione hydrolase
MTPEEVIAAVRTGAVVLDLRTPRPFARRHIAGAVNLQFNRADLAERADLLLPGDVALVVYAEPEPIARVGAKLLAEAGLHVLGHLEGGLDAWGAHGGATASTPLLDVDALRARLDEVQVVDAREPFEYRYAHVPGAFLLPWTQAWERVDSAPADRPLAVMCGDEVRSASLASVLQRAGRDAILVLGGMTDWIEKGYPVEKAKSATTP